MEWDTTTTFDRVHARVEEAILSKLELYQPIKNINHMADSLTSLSDLMYIYSYGAPFLSTLIFELKVMGGGISVASEDSNILNTIIRGDLESRVKSRKDQYIDEVSVGWITSDYLREELKDLAYTIAPLLPASDWLDYLCNLPLNVDTQKKHITTQFNINVVEVCILVAIRSTFIFNIIKSDKKWLSRQADKEV